MKESVIHLSIQDFTNNLASKIKYSVSENGMDNFIINEAVMLYKVYKSEVLLAIQDVYYKHKEDKLGYCC